MVDFGQRPLVSVLTATYNRANVLRYAIESVRRQTLSDWEMCVVGDACTDDTAELIRELNDPRVRFLNLPQNTGDQAGPNNEALRLSRGPFLAYLNHDDLWFPDHLETAVRALNETGADLVFPLIVKMDVHGAFSCADLTPDGRYEPHLSVPASFWVLRRELAEAAGPWRAHYECHATPSQDWLFRANRLGKDLRYIPRMTAIALPSGGRPGAYAKREFLENQRIFDCVQNDPGYREKVLIAVAERFSVLQSNPPVWREILRTVRDLIRRALAPYWGWPKADSYAHPFAAAIRKRARRFLGRSGMHPESVELRWKYGGPGGFIRFLRAFRGLPPNPGQAGE